MYEYEQTSTQEGRLAEGRDRCGSKYKEYDLVELVRARCICDPRDRRRRLTTAPIGSTIPNKFIFAVDVSYRLRLWEDGERSSPGSVKHESLFHNAPVRAAGELQIVDGEVVNVNDQSGTYGTRGALDSDLSFRTAVREALESAGASYSERVHQLLLSRQKV
jgi:hypothetical protein